MSQFDWPIATKKKLWRFPKIENSMERSCASPFGPDDIGNILGEHLRNPLRMSWEQIGNRPPKKKPTIPNFSYESKIQGRDYK